MKTARRLVLAFVILGCVGFFTLAASVWYYGDGGGMDCSRCHEIRPMVDSWAVSSHRGVKCKDCHGSSLSADLRMHAKNLQRVWLHSRGETPEQIHIRHEYVMPIVERCAGCHRQEYAEWRSGPHGMTYAAIFLDPEQNAGQQLTDDCLRCHAMHFEGGIRDLVTPLDREGRWTFVDPANVDRPALPCMACHSLHRKGEPLAPHEERAQVPGMEQEIVRPSLAFYDRRSFEHIGLEHLPMPKMYDGAQQVKRSPDQRQALCYQCHSPWASMQVFSSDDRTPVGVHEGLSCQACHAGHGQTTRASCAACHPRLSNCGLDVETMDTTFMSPDSHNDIHRVACQDCHPKGIPRKRSAALPSSLL